MTTWLLLPHLLAQAALDFLDFYGFGALLAPRSETRE